MDNMLDSSAIQKLGGDFREEISRSSSEKNQAELIVALVTYDGFMLIAINE